MSLDQFDEESEVVTLLAGTAERTHQEHHFLNNKSRFMLGKNPAFDQIGIEKCSVSHTANDSSLLTFITDFYAIFLMFFLSILIGLFFTYKTNI